MPLFDIEDARGRKLTVEGDVAPTESDAAELFAAHFGPDEAPQRAPSQRAIEARPRIQAEIEAKSDWSPQWLGDFLGAISGPNAMAMVPTGRNMLNAPVNFANSMGVSKNIVAPFNGVDMTGLSRAGLQVIEQPFKATYPGFTLTEENSPMAGVGRSVDATASGLTDPDMALTLPAFSTGIPQSIAPIATTARALMAVEMARHLPEVHARTSEVFSDPNSTPADKAEAAMNQITADAFAAGAAGQVVRAKGVNPDLLPRDPRQMAIDQAAVIRLGLPPRAMPEQIPSLELTKELVNLAVANANQPYGRLRLPFEQALEELRNQQLTPGVQLAPPEPRRIQEIPPGGGESTRGKISFNKPDFYFGEDTRVPGSFLEREDPNAPIPRQEPKSNQPEYPGASEQRPPTEAGSGNRAPEVGAVTPEEVNAALKARGYRDAHISRMTDAERQAEAAKPIPTQEADAIRYWENEDAITAEPDLNKRMQMIQDTFMERELIKNRNKKNPGGAPDRPSDAAPELKKNPESQSKSSKPFNWDAYTEALHGELEAFNPARHTGKPDYDLMDVGSRFSDFAKNRNAAGSLADLVKEFAKTDEATPTQIKKLRTAVKQLDSTGAAESAVNASIDAVDALKKKLQSGFQSGNASLGIPIAILDTALEAVRLALKSGKPLAKAIDAGISHIKYNFKGGKWNESEVRKMFEAELGGRGVQPAGAQPGSSSGGAGGRNAAAGTGAAAATAPSTPTAGGVPNQPANRPTPPAPGSPAAGQPRAINSGLDDIYKIFDPVKKAGKSVGARIVDVTEKVRTGVSSKFRPINKLAEDIAKAYGLSTPKDIAGFFEQLKGSQGKGEADVHRFDRDVSKLVEGSEKDFNAYIFLRRSLDRLNQDLRDLQAAQAGANIPNLNRRSVGNYIIPELEAKLRTLENKLGPEKTSDFQVAADLYQQHMDQALRLQVESGRMSPQVYQAIKSGNQFYAPFKVMRYIEETMKPEGTGAKVDTVADFTKAMKGIEESQLNLGDMLAAGRQNILLSRILADKNMAMRHISELAATDVNSIFIKKLAAGQDVPQGMKAVNVLERGKQQRYAVDPNVADALQLYGGNAGGVISRYLSAASVPFRAGATSLNLPFQISNLLADVPRQALISKYGLTGVTDLVRYPMDFVHSLYSSIAGDVFGARNQLFMDFLDSGVAGTTVQEMLTPNALKFKEPTTMSKAGHITRSIINTIPEFAKAIEQTSKVMGVKRAMRMEGVASGSELAKHIPEAITEIRRYSGSPDFGRQGKAVEAARLNLLYMFLNARIQGSVADISRLSGAHGKNSARAWARIATAVGIPTAYLWYLNNSPDNKADYDARPDQEKQNYWLIPKTDDDGKPRYITTEEGDKVRDYWRIPKRESSKWIGNLTEAALHFAQNRDPKAATDFGQQMLQELTPVNISGDNAQERLESVASSLNPTLKMPLELATGRDFYRHRDIMSDQLRKASPEEQYTDRTPEAFKKLANAMPDAMPEVLRSPIILENMTRNLTAGLLTQFMPRKPVEGRTAFENNPLMQRFQSLPMVENKEFQESLKGLEREAADESLKRHRAAIKVMDENPSAEPDKLIELAVAGHEFGSEDVKLAKHIVDLYVAKQNGATGKDRQVMALPARQRALWIQQQISGLTGDALNEKLQELSRKRILTEAAGEELSALMEKK